MSTRFTTLKEFYQAVDLLIGKLRAEGLAEEANRLHTLLHKVVWTNRSELLEELMLALKGMKGRYPENLREEVAECLEFTIDHRKILSL